MVRLAAGSVFLEITIYRRLEVDNAKRLHKDRANRYSNNQHHSYDVGNDPTIYSYYLNFLNLFEYKYFPGDNLVWAVVQQLFGRNCFKFNLLEAEFF